MEPIHRERGSATVEISVLAPALLLVVFTIIQLGLWSYARSLALGAAQEGAEAGRLYGASTASARSRAERFLSEQAGDSLLATAVATSVTATELRVDVVGRSLSVLPGVPGLPVRQTATAPLERFTAP